MGVFGEPTPCAACAAKESEITFLRSQVVSLQAKLLELTSPGSNARLAWVPPAPREAASRLPGTHSPSRLAALRPDRKPDQPAPVVPPDVQRAEIEASFDMRREP